MGTDCASPWFRAEARFQRAYARFLTDKRFRQQVLDASAPEGQSDLTETDIDRLRGMNLDRVEIFAQCLYGNRLAAIKEAFPLTFKVLGNSVQPLVRALDAVDVAVDTRKYPEAIRFANFALSGGCSEGSSVPESVLGLLQYELSMLNLRLRPHFPEWPDLAVRSGKSLQQALEAGEDICLVRNQNSALLSVAFDIEALRELPQDVLPVATAGPDNIILLYRGENGVVHEQCLNHSSAAAILMIDGTRTFQALVTAYAEWSARPFSADLANGLMTLCVSLCTCRALGYLPLRCDPDHVAPRSARIAP